MSGLCPDPLESPREGREERRIDGGREVAWTPKIDDRSQPLICDKMTLKLLWACRDIKYIFGLQLVEKMAATKINTLISKMAISNRLNNNNC